MNDSFWLLTLTPPPQASLSFHHSLTLSEALGRDTGDWWGLATRASFPETASVVAESPPSGPGCTQHTPTVGPS